MGFFVGPAVRVFGQTVLRTVIASIVAVRCFVEVTSLNVLLPELYLTNNTQCKTIHAHKYLLAQVNSICFIVNQTNVYR